MKIVKKILLSLLLLAAVAGISFYAGYNYENKNIEIVKCETRSNVVEHKLDKMTVAEKDIVIDHYGTDDFFLDLQPLPGRGNYLITGSLYDRQAIREINIPIQSSGNFKFYIGMGSGLVGSGAVCYATGSKVAGSIIGIGGLMLFGYGLYKWIK